MPSSPRRHFLPWDRPLLPQAVAFLADGWNGQAALDLSDVLLVVPTRQSGRRVREALAEFAAGRDAAVFPPRVVTPELLVGAPGGPNVATRLDLLLAWMDVVGAADLTEFREVFPVDPPARNFSWALRVAEQFLQIQAILAENGLQMAEVPRRVAADFPETERWRQLATLEQRFTQRLEQASRRTPLAGARHLATPPWLEGIRRIVVLATPDPIPAVVTALEAAAQRVPADVVVFAPADAAEQFDGWGRPRPEVWSERHLVMRDFEQRVRLCADPADQARRIAGLVAAYAAKSTPSAGGGVGVGVAAADVVPLLVGELTRRSVPVFVPEGSRFRDGALYQLVAALAALARSADFGSVAAVVRCRAMLAYLAAEGGPNFSGAAFLAELDKLQQKHLPADLAAGLGYARGALLSGLRRIDALRARLVAGDLPEALAGVLAEIFGAQPIDSAAPENGELREAASALVDVLRECATAAERFPGRSQDDWWELILRGFGDGRRSAEKPEGAVELQGWLELLFEDAPHLVVAGCNDGVVPEAVGGDAFLPESLRARLGLKTNAARFARDAYLLQALVASRDEAGRLDVLLGKTSAAGDPLRPSRLLLRCPDAELPARVAFLFRTPESASSHLPWRRAWALQPPQRPVPAHVAVTSLRRWLACPFRFYLKYVLRMEAVDPAKSEMDAFDFGTLCHAALEAMGRDAVQRDATDPGALREFLWAELARTTRERYGDALPLPLLIQLESARQRLGKLAELQARDRAEGWVIQEVERPFAVEIAGLTVKGKIDRIDRNELTGAVRVLDYKTSDTAVSPVQAHVRPIGKEETLPEWATVQMGDKRRAWLDLQLPLYRHALAPEFGDELGCGYVNLPKAVSQTAVVLWDDYSRDVQAAARACAEGVCAAIRAGQFWPPNEDIRAESDEFAPLFHQGVAASVAAAGTTLFAVPETETTGGAV